MINMCRSCEHVNTGGPAGALFVKGVNFLTHASCTREFYMHMCMHMVMWRSIDRYYPRDTACGTTQAIHTPCSATAEPGSSSFSNRGSRESCAPSSVSSTARARASDGKRWWFCGLQGSTCSNAAAGGHLEVLQWARANGCEWHSGTCSNAAEGGHLEVLQWARANGCLWNAYTCSNAAAGGHLEVLQWARANGCEWNATTCEQAAFEGHLEVLQWARTNGCPWVGQTRKEGGLSLSLLSLSGLSPGAHERPGP